MKIKSPSRKTVETFKTFSIVALVGIILIAAALGFGFKAGVDYTNQRQQDIKTQATALVQAAAVDSASKN